MPVITALGKQGQECGSFKEGYPQLHNNTISIKKTRITEEMAKSSCCSPKDPDLSQHRVRWLIRHIPTNN